MKFITIRVELDLRESISPELADYRTGEKLNLQRWLISLVPCTVCMLTDSDWTDRFTLRLNLHCVFGIYTGTVIIINGVGTSVNGSQMVCSFIFLVQKSYTVGETNLPNKKNWCKSMINRCIQGDSWIYSVFEFMKCALW